MKRSISLRTFTAGCFAGFVLLVQLAGAQVSNFDACRYGYVTCNPSGLTANEQAQVAVAAHARNFDACRYGYVTCNPSGLTANEQAQVAVAPSTPRVTVPVNTGTGLCAENGSCYGDANDNGVPKTVHVNGYYRKDGTYVRGHYRSAPGTNPRKR